MVLKKCNVRVLVFIALATGLLGQPFFVFAQTNGVDYENIISDNELIAYQTMSALTIQQFLENRSSYLKSFMVSPDDGSGPILASQYIYNISQKHRVNPRFLLALLQKEQGLIEEQTPKQTQLDWAMGYGCFDGQPCNERWRGFHKQINSAAEQFRYYYEHIEEYPYRPGITFIIDGTPVMPKNIATAALYNYTPHLQGNRLLRQLWEKYFVQRLPDGSLVQVQGEQGVWLLQDGFKRPFTSRLALVSRYNPNLVLTVSSADLDQYARGLDIDFAAYSLLRGVPSGNIYLLTTDAKRLITSMEVFRSLGFNPEEVEDVPDAELTILPDGRPITMGDSYPTGAVLKNAQTGDLFYVEAGRKYPLYGKELLTINYPAKKVSTISADQLSNFSTGFPVYVKEGTLVKGSGPEVYVISNQKKRHIATEAAFNSIGYKWSNIIVISDTVLDLHALGDPVIIK